MASSSELHAYNRQITTALAPNNDHFDTIPDLVQRYNKYTPNGKGKKVKNPKPTRQHRQTDPVKLPALEGENFVIYEIYGFFEKNGQDLGAAQSVSDCNPIDAGGGFSYPISCPTHPP